MYIKAELRLSLFFFPDKFGFVGVLGFCRIRYLHLMREVDFAKQKTEGEIARAFTTPQSCLRQASSPDKWSYAIF
jgi:hypothetical protein